MHVRLYLHHVNNVVVTSSIGVERAQNTISKYLQNFNLIRRKRDDPPTHHHDWVRQHSMAADMRARARSLPQEAVHGIVPSIDSGLLIMHIGPSKFSLQNTSAYIHGH